VDKETRDLIRKMSEENVLWGSQRILDELEKLGIEVGLSSVLKYMVKRRSPPPQTWKTFLQNHMHNTASMDFMVVPTISFNLLYVLVILRHERRRLIHFNVTASLTAIWVAQQLKEAFPWDTAPKYLIRDRDSIYGEKVKNTITLMGIEEVLTAPKSPWQNPFSERVIGTLRRDALDHVIVLNEDHLHMVLVDFLDYYHSSRTHMSLYRDSPEPREVHKAEEGTIISFPQVGGLHHRYERQNVA
jgi:putative transposase